MSDFTYESACQYLQRRIVERFGDHPDVLDELEIQIVPCSHKGGIGKGNAIVAWPIGQRITEENSAVAYWGDPI